MAESKRRKVDPRKPHTISFTGEEWDSFVELSEQSGVAVAVVVHDAALAGRRLVADRYRKQVRNPERKVERKPTGRKRRKP